MRSLHLTPSETQKPSKVSEPRLKAGLLQNQWLFRTPPELPQILFCGQLSRAWDPLFLSLAAKSLIYPCVSCKYGFSLGLGRTALCWTSFHSFICSLFSCLSRGRHLGAVCVLKVQWRDRQESATSSSVWIERLMEKGLFFFLSDQFFFPVFL